MIISEMKSFSLLFRPKYIDRKLLVLNVREQLFIMSIAKKGKALSV